MRKLFIPFLVVFVAGLTGCSDSPTVPGEQISGQPLSSPVPPNVENLLEQNADFGDLSPTANTTPPDLNIHDYDVYAVTFLWGHLADVSTQPPVHTDWSGMLSVNAEGLVDVRHLIDFEPGQDSLVPVGTPTTIEWVSETGFDIDGISFRIYLKRGNIYITPPVLTFATTPITLQFSFHELERLVAYYPVANGQGVAVLARRIWHSTCPSGGMRGEWVRENNTGHDGFFGGVWLDRDGEPAGLYNGRFWLNNDNRGEFHGWVSGYVTDQVIAEFSGHWRYDDPRLCPTCGDDHGWFCGKIRWLENDRIGVMKGEFGNFTGPVDHATLPMVGVWRMVCHSDNASVTAPNSP